MCARADDVQAVRERRVWLCGAAVIAFAWFVPGLQRTYRALPPKASLRLKPARRDPPVKTGPSPGLAMSSRLRCRCRRRFGARRGLENGPKRRIKLPLLGIRYKAIPSPIPSHFFAEKVRVPKAQIANFAPPIRGAMAGAVRLRGRSERLMFDSLIGARF